MEHLGTRRASPPRVQTGPELTPVMLRGRCSSASARCARDQPEKLRRSALRLGNGLPAAALPLSAKPQSMGSKPAKSRFE